MMTFSRDNIVGWLQDEFDTERRGGFMRLRRVPDTRVIRFLDHFEQLSSSDQAELVTALAERKSDPLSGVPAPPSPVVEQFTAATTIRSFAEGIRYTGVNLLAGLAKSKTYGGLADWLLSNGITGLAAQLPTNLAQDLRELIPVKIPTLRWMVRSGFARLFGADAKDIGSEMWSYEEKLEGAPLKVIIRYSGRMGRPQLAYQVEMTHTLKEWPVTARYLCFESVLGVGFGHWDYLTQTNAERSVDLLCELVAYVVQLPKRIPK